MNRLSLVPFIIFILIGCIVTAQTNECRVNLKQAADLFAKRKYADAITQYNMVIERSNYYDAYYGRGLCYYMLENNSLALHDFNNTEVFRNHEKDISYYWYRGQTHHRMSHWKAALEDYKLAELYGGDLNIQLGLSIGTVYYFLGDMVQAKRYLKSYLSNNFEVEGGWTNLGWIYLTEGLPDSADYAFDNAYSLSIKSQADSSTLAKCMNNLGYAQGLNGKFDEGMELIQSSIKINPKNAFAYRNIGYLFMIKGNKPKACENLKIAIDMKIEKDWDNKYINELQEYCE